MTCIRVLATALFLTVLFPSAPVDAATVTLGWTAPVQNEDGSSVQDLSGFNIYSRIDTNFVHGQGIVSTVLEGIDPIPGPSDEYSTDISLSATAWFCVTAFDFAGNESDFSESLQVDATPPYITLAGGDPMLLERGTPYSEPGYTASDDIDGDVTADVIVSGVVDHQTVGVYLRYYNVQDSSGNDADQEVRVVNVVDSGAPEITLLGANPVYLERGTPYSEPGYTAIDNTDGDISANVQIAGSVNHTSVGTYHLYYNVQDSSGNDAVQKSRTIHVVDLAAPIIALQGDNPLTVSRGTPYAEPGYAASDDVDGNITASVIVTGNVDHNTVGAYQLYYDVQDSSGNDAIQRERTINVIDATPPQISLLGDNPLALARGTAYVEPGYSALDDVDGDVTAQVQVTGSVDHNTLGTYFIYYNVQDLSGNHASQRTRAVQVVDAGAPEIVLTGDNPLNMYRGTPYIEPGYSAIDDLEGDLTADVIVTGTVDHDAIGLYRLYYDVQDSSGNDAAQQVRIVYVRDGTAPQITLQGDNPLDLPRGTVFVDPGYTASDDIDGNLTADVVVSGAVDHDTLGTYHLYYDVQDDSGNDADQQVRTVHVIDTTAPQIILLGDNPLDLPRGTAYVEPGYTASDEVDGDLTASVVVGGAIDHNTLGTYRIYYNVLDSSGNAAPRQVRTVNVIDVARPQITLLGDNPLDLSLGTAYFESGFTASDDVDGDLTDGVMVTGSVDHNTIGTYHLYYNVQDSSGNAAIQRIRTVNVVDSAPPIITLLGDNPLTLPAGTPYAEPGFTASDGVDGNLTAGVTVSGTVDHNTVGTYRLYYDVQDNSGNVAVQRVRTINVIDSTRPTITLFGDNPRTLFMGTPYVESGYAASDDVDGNLTSSVVVSGTVDHNIAGSYQVYYDVQDSSGNAAIQRVRTVNVVDATRPVITLLGDNPLTLLVGTAYTESGYTASDNADGDVTASVTVSGTVDHNTVGAYQIYYDVQDSSGNDAVQRVRTVNVIDATRPVITLLGDNPLTLPAGTPYGEPGFAATDDVDGDLALSVLVSGAVDHHVPGAYLLYYDVQDSSGNDAVQRVRTVNVVDTTRPVIALLGDNPLTLLVGTPYTEPGFTASDDVDGNLTSSVTISGTVGHNTVGAYPIHYDVQDSSGNDAVQRVRTVNVVDSTRPVIALLGDNPLTLPAGTPYAEPGFAANDDVDGDLTATVTVSGVVDHTTIGAYQLYYDVQDSSGNDAVQRVRTVNVVDSTRPVIALLGDNPLTLPAGTPYAEPGFTASDDVDGNLTASVTVSGTVDHNTVGAYHLYYDVQDSSGNDAVQRVRTVNVVDTTRPVITLLGDNPLTISAGTPYAEPGFTAGDDVDGNLSAGVTVSGTVNHNTVGAYQLYYDVQDSSGNEAVQRVRTVNVVDTTRPAITLLGDNPLTLPAGTPYVEPGFTAGDDVDGNLTATVTVSGVVDHTTVGAYQLYYDVQDSSGNDAVQRIRTVNVTDANRPVITLLGDNPLTLPAGTPYTDPGYAASDDLDGDLTSGVVTSGTVDHNTPGAYRIYYDVQDSSGNAAVQRTRTVNVVDSTRPIITLLGDNPILLLTGAPYTEPGYVASDDVDGDLTSSVVVSGTVDPNTPGSYPVHYDVRDASGNDAVRQIRMVNVIDSLPPVITLLGELSVTLQVGIPYVEPGYWASDNADGDVTDAVVISGAVDHNTPGLYQIHYDVRDSSGNDAVQRVRTVSVVDTTRPTITLLGDNPLILLMGTPYAEPGYAANDNADGDLTSSVVVSGAVEHDTPGTYLLYYDVQDSSGNDAVQGVRTVTVVDSARPYITLLGDNPLNLPAGTPYLEPGYTANDDVDQNLTSSVVISGTVDHNTVGAYRIYYDVQDSSGNDAVQRIRTVNVIDSTPPVITLLGHTELPLAFGTPYVEQGYWATDNVDGDVAASVVVYGSVDHDAVGAYRIYYDVQDSSGNDAVQRIRTVNVIDSTRPTITLLGDNPLTLPAGTPYGEPGYTASDNADGDLTVSVAVSGGVDHNTPGTHRVFYNVQDRSGNVAFRQVRTVYVVDTTPPVITLLGDNPLALPTGTPYVEPGFTASDLVDGNITASVLVTGQVDHQTPGRYRIYYNIQDRAGNAAAQRIRTVDVVDSTRPVITLLGDTSLTLQIGTPYLEPGYRASDDADGDISAGVIVSGELNEGVAGVYQLYYDVQDSSGNDAVQRVRTVTVVDSARPSIALLGDNPLTLLRGAPYVEPGYTATDDADGDLTANVAVSGAVDHNVIGSYQIAYDVQDSSGNDAVQRIRTVNVIDSTRPVITLLGDNPLTLPSGTPYVEPGYAANDDIDENLTASVVISGTVDHNNIGAYRIFYDVQDSSGNDAVQRVRTVNVVDSTPPVITLLGQTTIPLSVGTPYVEKGYWATDNVDGDLVANVRISGAVDHNTPGTYLLHYDLQDSSGNDAVQRVRTINVIDSTSPVITLLGDNPLTLPAGTPYTEPGYTALDNADGDITANVMISGSVDHNTPGAHRVFYNVQDSSGNVALRQVRTVNVVDTTSPVITLLGDNPLTLPAGTPYIEPGFTASDQVDGNITSSVIVSGVVDSDILGTYRIYYDIQDRAGNDALQRVRTVNVIEAPRPVITLIGANPLTLAAGTPYTEPGYAASSAPDGDLTSSVVMTGAVDHNTPGAYQVFYDVQDSAGHDAVQKVRTVNVVDSGQPVITLLGGNPIDLTRGTPYAEPGYTASDAVDGDLTAAVVVSGAVDHNSLGSYQVQYNVQDGSGNDAVQQVRTIHVVEPMDVPPSASAPYAPVGTIETTKRPTFTWAEVGNAEWYQLSIVRDGQSYHSQWIKAATSWTPDWDFEPGEYSWSVHTWNTFGFGAWSESMTFDIPAKIPGIITLYSPAGSIEANPAAFEWSHDDKAEWYRLYVQRNGKKAINRWVKGSTTYKPVKKEVLRYGNYAWWVQGWGPDGLGPWSEAKEFAYGITQPVDPAGLVRTRRPTFHWTGVPDAEWYNVWIGRDGKEYDALWVQGANTWTPPTELPYGSYTWCVLAWNPQGTGPWSDKGGFTVGEAIPLSPAGDVLPTSASVHGVDMTEPTVVTWDDTGSHEAEWYHVLIQATGEDYADFWIDRPNTFTEIQGEVTASIPLDYLPLPAGHYTWRVQSWRPGGAGPWSQSLDFRVLE